MTPRDPVRWPPYVTVCVPHPLTLAPGFNAPLTSKTAMYTASISEGRKFSISYRGTAKSLYRVMASYEEMSETGSFGTC